MTACFKIAALVLLLTQLGACASNAHCRRAQDYQSEQDRAPLTGTEELNIKESASALRIPPPVQSPVAFGEKVRDEKGGEAWSCLDIPPRLATEEKPKS